MISLSKKTGLLLTALLSAGGLQTATAETPRIEAFDWIPADVMVVGQLDMKPILAHPALEPIRLAVQQGEADKGLDQFAEWTGIDPRENIEQIYFFAYPEDRGGGAIVEGSFDTARLQKFFNEQFWVRKETTGDVTLYEWWDENQKKDVSAVLDGAHRIVIGDPAAVKGAASAYRAERPAITQTAEEVKIWTNLLDRPDGLLSVVLFPDPDQTEDETIKQLKEASLAVDMNEELIVELISGWKSEEQATAIADFARAAWNAHMELKIKPTQPELAELMKQMSISSAGTSAAMTMAIPMQFFAEKIEAALD